MTTTATTATRSTWAGAGRPARFTYHGRNTTRPTAGEPVTAELAGGCVLLRSEHTGETVANLGTASKFWTSAAPAEATPVAEPAPAAELVPEVDALVAPVPEVDPAEVQAAHDAMAAVLATTEPVGGPATADGVASRLAELRDLEAELAAERVALVAQLRNVHGYSWQAVGDVLGISKQGASKVYGAAAEAALRGEFRRARQAWTPAAGWTAPAPALELVAPAVPVAAPAVDVPLELEPVAVYVVPCGRLKLDHPAPAGELYTGAHFRRTLELVTAAADRDGALVRIMSAAHGLVSPDQVVGPYDVAMGKLDRDARMALEAHVAGQLRRLGVTHVQAWLPNAYRSVLLEGIYLAGWTTDPAWPDRFTDHLAGTRGIGEQRARIGQLEPAPARRGGRGRSQV